MLTDNFFEQVANVVIVEGGFFTEVERHQLINALQSWPHAMFITLHASFDTVQGRVMGDADPGRVASKVPTYLKYLYAEYEAALPYLRDTSTCIQVDDSDIEQAGRQIAALVKIARGD